MFLSVFELFKIGIGPSSSHTVGPMVGAARFLEALSGMGQPAPGADRPERIRVTLYGSLAFTGKGHGTDRAIVLGLHGAKPDEIEPEEVDGLLEHAQAAQAVDAGSLGPLAFDPQADVVFDYGPALPGHANGMVFSAVDAAGNAAFSRTYYSIGGGFVLSADELKALDREARTDGVAVPYPFSSAVAMLDMGDSSGLSIAEMKRANEIARMGRDDLVEGLDRIWAVMNDCIDRGLERDGVLPGGLKVKRRAKGIHDQLVDEKSFNMPQPHRVMDWLGVYAMAVNEENAAGGRVVTAPTNGAAGVIPAVIRYYQDHCVAADREGIRTFLLTAAAIGGIIKHNASISGAEVGCQGEVGSAAAMAAAGLCAALGGTNAQVENAAEIALEHHLGMTCDPVGGLVQVPCIERNSLGAVKAVTAASLALRGDGTHFVPLDTCIATMRETGRDMSDKYKETSTGGLAVNVVAC